MEWHNGATGDEYRIDIVNFNNIQTIELTLINSNRMSNIRFNWNIQAIHDWRAISAVILQHELISWCRELEILVITLDDISTIVIRVEDEVIDALRDIYVIGPKEFFKLFMLDHTKWLVTKSP